MDFTGKVAAVTGAASGMGAATARLFAEAGAWVVIVDRDEPQARQVAADIGADAPVVGDVADSSFCKQAINTAVERYGQLDILVNAAGIIRRADTLATSDEDWQQVINVNVNGLFYMSRAAVSVMRQHGAGSIVNFGSIWGSVGAAGVIAYCASKGAVHQITKAMALEYVRNGIRVNAVCPGEVNTPMLKSERAEPVTPQLLAALAGTVPLGRLAEPEEIARVVLFLASDAASYMTGSLVNVDAGFTAR